MVQTGAAGVDLCSVNAHFPQGHPSHPPCSTVIGLPWVGVEVRVRVGVCVVPEMCQTRVVCGRTGTNPSHDINAATSSEGGFLRIEIITARMSVLQRRKIGIFRD